MGKHKLVGIGQPKTFSALSPA